MLIGGTSLYVKTIRRPIIGHEKKTLLYTKFIWLTCFSLLESDSILTPSFNVLFSRIKYESSTYFKGVTSTKHKNTPWETSYQVTNALLTSKPMLWIVILENKPTC